MLKRAGLDVEPQNSPLDLSPDALDLTLDLSRVSQANLLAVQSRIEGDLKGEREELIDIQGALVTKVFQARLQKLGDLPLDAEDDSDLDLDSDDLGAAMLEKIIEDLTRTMKLLPETTERIRGDGKTVTESGRE